MKKILSLLLIIVCTGCFAGSSNSADAAADVFSQLNEGRFDAVWESVAPQSQEAVARQLKNNQTTRAGRSLATGFLGISEEKLLKLSPKDYFILIMQKGYDPHAPKVVIESISEEADTATIHWRKGQRVGQSKMVRQNGRWLFVLDSVA